MRDALLGLVRSSLARQSPPRPLLHCLLLAAAIAAVAVVLARPVLFGPTPTLYGNDQHRFASLDIAVNRAVCGRLSHAHPGHRLRQFLLADGYRSAVPLVELPGRLAGSVEAYCAALVPVRIGDNSLTLTMQALLALRPRLTLEQLGHTMRWLRVGCLVFVAFVILRIGGSALLALATVYAAVIVVSAVEGNRFHSVYPWFGPLLLTFAALLVLGLDLGAHLRWWTALPWSVAVGWIAAFVAQWRASYLPILIACVALACWLGWRDPRWRDTGRARTLGRQVLLPLAVAGFGAFLFYRSLIAPIAGQPVVLGTIQGTVGDIARHDVALPIVLGLAMPDNDLARREGIVWLDAAGTAIARRLDPGVIPYSARQERALFRYYGALWRDHPGELVGLYLRKWSIAGTDIPRYRAAPLDTRFFRWMLAPLRTVTSGFVLSALLALVIALGCARVGRWRLGACAGLALYGVIGLLLMGETALILTYFYVSHESAQMLVVLLLSLLAQQAVVDLVARGLGRISPGRRGRGRP